MAVATSRSELILHREMFYEETYLLFILKTYQLTYCQKFLNLTTRAVHSNEYDRTGGHNFFMHSVIRCTLCNLEDLDCEICLARYV